jgi:uncharacterized protein DUF5674
MQLVTDSISLAELKQMSEKMYGNLVKAVVDIEKGIMAVNAGLHADQEKFLLEEHGSKQQNLWGINLHPDQSLEDFIEFDSMINIRPVQKNRSRSVDDPQIREKIVAIVTRLVKR